MPDPRGTILVTRPAQQAASLIQHIQSRGGQVLACPVLDIIQATASPELCQQLQALDQAGMAIFISPNAVHAGLSLLQQCELALPSTLTLACVGASSANQLAEQTGRTVLSPQHNHDSEGLLALPELQQVNGQRITILRGNGGRELLAEALSQRGARVSYIEVYRREVPPASQALQQALQKQALGVILITSGEGLRNLVLMAQPFQSELLATPLMVVNARQAELAAQLGFKQVMQAHAARDDAMLTALQQHGFMD